MSLNERVLSRLSLLSPKLQRAALYVVEHPEEVATRSLRQVARANEMSAPTFSRLAHVLEFDSFDELRDACVSELKTQGLSYAAKARALQDTTGQRDPGGAFVVHQAKASVTNINRLVTTVNPMDIEAASERIALARKVVLVGMMSSRPFVDYAAYVASLAFDNWRVYGGEAGAGAALLSDVGGDDVALVISAAPYARRAIEAARHLRAAGVHVIGITDGLSSPLASHANSVFIVSTETPQFFTSHAATLVLLETLIGLVVKASGAAVNERIDRVVAQCHAMGEYCQPPN